MLKPPPITVPAATRVRSIALLDHGGRGRNVDVASSSHSHSPVMNRSLYSLIVLFHRCLSFEKSPGQISLKDV